MKRTRAIWVLVVLAGALTWIGVQRVAALGANERGARGASAPVPVEVGPVERGPITLRRAFSGTLEASAELVAAPKVGGRVARLEVNLGDVVRRGQVVAFLDDDELRQEVIEAEAELAVAQASHQEAKSTLEIAERALQRAERLKSEGVSSESQLDAARAAKLAAGAHVEVTQADIARSQASLEAARIRLGYARVTADWSEGDDERVVAERHVDEGGTVPAGAPLFTIVDLDPIEAVVQVPERDYARLAQGQTATLVTDSHPGRTFTGEVARIAPVFRSTTRQARVELLVQNAGKELKPGMFVRAELALERVAVATTVPFDALCERDGTTGVFVVDDSGTKVHWRPVGVGIREGARVQVLTGGLEGKVVTLGQELCDDGSAVRVAGE